MKQKVYISGQITGLTQEEYTRNFVMAELALDELGYEFVNPLRVQACVAEVCAAADSKKDDGTYLHSWQCYLKYDLIAMLKCDAVAMLSNWRNSKGAMLERDVAMKCGMHIMYFDNIRGDLIE